MYQQLQIKLLARCGLISLKQNRKKTLNEEYGNGFFRQLCNCLVAKKHWEPRNDKTLTSCYLLRISWITLITRNSWIICSMYPSVNWKDTLQVWNSVIMHLSYYQVLEKWKQYSRIQCRLIFAIVIRCYRLRFWVG